MEEEIRMNNRKKVVKRWLEGEKEDVTVTEQIAWSFLPRPDSVIITENRMVYMN